MGIIIMTHLIVFICTSTIQYKMFLIFYLALSTANTKGVIEGTGVDLGGGGGLTDGLSNSSSFVSASCMLSRDALSPTSAREALERPSVVPVRGSTATSQSGNIGPVGSDLSYTTTARVFLPIHFSSSGIPATRVFTGMAWHLPMPCVVYMRW